MNMSAVVEVTVPLNKLAPEVAALVTKENRDSQEIHARPLGIFKAMDDPEEDDDETGFED